MTRLSSGLWDRRFFSLVVDSLLFGSLLLAGTLLSGFLLLPAVADEKQDAEEEEPSGPRAVAVESMNRMNTLAGEEMVGIQTEHFELYYSLSKLKANKRLFRKQDGAELYAKRLEEVWAKCAEVLPPRPGIPVRKRHRIILTESQKAFQKVARKLTGHTGGAGTYLYGVNSMFATYFERNPEIRDDRSLHEKVAHHVAHLIIQDFGSTNLNFPAWAHVGFAHWVEHELFGKNRFFCFTEVPEKDRWRDANWPLKVRKEVARNKHLSLAAIATKPLDALTYRDMAYSMSYVDFLIETDREKFEHLIRELKRSSDTRSAIKKVYGWILGDLEKEWKKHASRSTPN